MGPNQNPPYEREWTTEEREEFFKLQDALAGILNGISNQPPIEWSTSAWNGKILDLDPSDPFGDIDRIFRRGIHVTKIIPPEHGWPISFHCPICKKTVFILSLYAEKPKDGYYFRLNDTCVDDVHGFEHNMRLRIKGYNAPIDLKPRGLL